MGAGTVKRMLLSSRQREDAILSRSSGCGLDEEGTDIRGVRETELDLWLYVWG